MEKEILDLYSVYLINSFNYTTATDLAAALDRQISHDKVTCFLVNQDFDAQQLWLLGKPIVSYWDCKATEIETIYPKRWRVEVFHKTLKSNAGLPQSPTKCFQTQSNHIFIALCAVFQLEA